MRHVAALATILGTSAGVLAQPVQIATWTFETSVPASAGPHSAEGGINAGAGSPAAAFHADAATVYSNPAGNGSPESFSSNFWAIGDYYEFRTSTVGFTDITVTWHQTRSSTGPGTFDVVWSTDGVTFSTLVDDYTVLNNATPPGVWNATTQVPEYAFAPVSLPVAATGAADLYIRLVNQVAPGGTAGTNRVDNVSIDGVAKTTGCYPDCNEDSALTIADFGCFQSKFVALDPYADCNGDTAFTIADFACFQAAFVAGCP